MKIRFKQKIPFKFVVRIFIIFFCLIFTCFALILPWVSVFFTNGFEIPWNYSKSHLKSFENSHCDNPFKTLQYFWHSLVKFYVMVNCWKNLRTGILLEEFTYRYIAGRIYVQVNCWKNLRTGILLEEFTYRYIAGRIYVQVYWWKNLRTGMLLKEFTYRYIAGRMYVQVYCWTNIRTGKLLEEFTYR